MVANQEYSQLSLLRRTTLGPAQSTSFPGFSPTSPAGENPGNDVASQYVSIDFCCVFRDNIGYGEGESGFSFGNSVHFRPDIGGQPKNIGIFVMCLNRFCLRTVTL